MNLYKLLLGSIFLLLLGSCTDVYENDDSIYNPDIIQWRVSVLENDNTRGIPISSAQDADFNSVGLMAYQTEEHFENTTAPTSAFFPNKEARKNSADNWGLDKIYYWPQSGYISFFAYAPYANANNGITITPNQTGAPVLNYTVPPLVENQPDLMIATPKMNLFKEVADLEFSHALACISFDVSSEDNLPIEYIGVKNVYTSGTISLDMNNKTPVWDNLGGKSNTLYEVGLIEKPLATNPPSTIMATDGYLMMLPQTLDATAQIVIKFQGIDEKTISLSKLNKGVWTAGYKYNYTLKEGIYDFIVTPNKEDVPYNGGEINLSITSTYTNANSEVIDLGWTVALKDPIPNDTYWTDQFGNLSNLTGNVKSETVVINTAPFTIDANNVIDTELRSSTIYDRSSIKDLSAVNGSNSTANTYVANARGWFKIPCTVIGNAVRDGDISTPNNSDCFSTPGTAFVDYKGNSITQLSDLLINITNPTIEVLWSDVPGLVSQEQLSADSKYIEFYIAPECMRQGNAVIAIKDGNDIVWSWQIWVTNWTLGSKEQVLGNSNPNLMPYAVGRCSAETYSYIPRSVTLVFTQNTSNKTQEIKINQMSQDLIYAENAPYYQWGRKDPMLAENGEGGGLKPSFGTTTYEVSQTTTAVPINQGILNPNIFYQSVTDPKNWMTPVNPTLWGCYTTSSTVNVKSIYDPSPIGYMMPTEDVLFDFLSLQYKYVYSPVEGCSFSANNNGDYNIFLASYGARTADAGVIYAPTPQMNVEDLEVEPRPGKTNYGISRYAKEATTEQVMLGSYWNNFNFYWANPTQNPDGVNLFFNLLFPTVNGQPYYQANNAACGLSVCGIVESPPTTAPASRKIKRVK